jgi:hypothetical protein
MAINETPIPNTLTAVIGTDFAPRGIPSNTIEGFIIQSESFDTEDIAEEVFDQLGAKVGHQVYDRKVTASLQVIGATTEAKADDLIGKTWELDDPIDGTKQDFYVTSVSENGSYNGLRTWTISLTRNYFWPKRK